MVGGDGFEPPNHKELSYSQPRLASSLPPQLYLLRMVPTIGIEPTTYWLQVSCSTNWAKSAHLWWRLRDLNPWPSACKADALPTELSLHIIYAITDFLSPFHQRLNIIPSVYFSVNNFLKLFYIFFNTLL